MTLKQAIEYALSYADMNLSDCSYNDCCRYADEAQKILAKSFGEITGRFEVIKPDSSPVIYKFPENSTGFKAIKRRCSVIPVSYLLRGDDKIIISDYGHFNIYYYVAPTEINEKTDKDYIFEIAAEAHNSIPLYIAYRLCQNKKPAVAAVCLNKWELQNKLVSQRVTAASHARYLSERNYTYNG